MDDVDACVAAVRAFPPKQAMESDELPLPPGIDKAGLTAVLNAFRAGSLSFRFHDPLHPSLSDPGAFLSYEPASSDHWRLSIANHGWSDGVYEIPEATVLRQLHHLIVEGHLKSLRYGRLIFRRAEPKSESQNATKNAELGALHAELSLDRE